MNGLLLLNLVVSLNTDISKPLKKFILTAFQLKKLQLLIDFSQTSKLIYLMKLWLFYPSKNKPKLVKELVLRLSLLVVIEMVMLVSVLKLAKKSKLLLKVPS